MPVPGCGTEGSSPSFMSVGATWIPCMCVYERVSVCTRVCVYGRAGVCARGRVSAVGSGQRGRRGRKAAISGRIGAEHYRRPPPPPRDPPPQNSRAHARVGPRSRPRLRPPPTPARPPSLRCLPVAAKGLPSPPPPPCPPVALPGRRGKGGGRGDGGRGLSVVGRPAFST